MSRDNSKPRHPRNKFELGVKNYTNKEFLDAMFWLRQSHKQHDFQPAKLYIAFCVLDVDLNRGSSFRDYKAPQAIQFLQEAVNEFHTYEDSKILGDTYQNTLKMTQEKLFEYGQECFWGNKITKNHETSFILFDLALKLGFSPAMIYLPGLIVELIQSKKDISRSRLDALEFHKKSLTEIKNWEQDFNLNQSASMDFKNFAQYFLLYESEAYYDNSDYETFTQILRFIISHEGIPQICRDIAQVSLDIYSIDHQITESIPSAEDYPSKSLPALKAFITAEAKKENAIDIYLTNLSKKFIGWCIEIKEEYDAKKKNIQTFQQQLPSPKIDSANDIKSTKDTASSSPPENLPASSPIEAAIGASLLNNSQSPQAPTTLPPTDQGNSFIDASLRNSSGAQMTDARVQSFEQTPSEQASSTGSQSDQDNSSGISMTDTMIQDSEHNINQQAPPPPQDSNTDATDQDLSQAINIEALFASYVENEYGFDDGEKDVEKTLSKIFAENNIDNEIKVDDVSATPPTTFSHHPNSNHKKSAPQTENERKLWSEYRSIGEPPKNKSYINSVIKKYDALLTKLEKYGPNDPEWHLKTIVIKSKASVYEQYDFFKEAESVFSGAFLLAPQEPAFLLGYAHLKETQQYYDLALTKYLETIAIIPNDIDAIIGQARCLESMHRYDDACLLYEKHEQLLMAENDLDKYISFLMSYAHCLAKKEAFSEAEKQYSKALSQKKLSGKAKNDIQSSLSICYQSQRKHQLSINALKYTSKSASLSSQLHRARAYLELEKFVAAEKLYRTIFEKCNKNIPEKLKINCLLSWARVYQQQGRYAEAINKYKEIFIFSQGNIKALVGILHCYHEAGDYQQAIQYYNQNTNYNHKSKKSILEVMLSIYSAHNSHALEKETIDKLLKIEPRNTVALLAEAKYLEKIGAHKRANECYEQARKNFPYNPEIRIEYFLLHAQRGNVNTEQFYNELMHDFKYTVQIHIKLIEYYIDKNLDRSHQLCQKLLTQPQILTVHELWVKICIQKGETQIAVDYCEKLLADENYSNCPILHVAHLRALLSHQPKKAEKLRKVYLGKFENHHLCIKKIETLFTIDAAAIQAKQVKMQKTTDKPNSTSSTAVDEEKTEPKSKPQSSTPPNIQDKTSFFSNSGPTTRQATTNPQTEIKFESSISVRKSVHKKNPISGLRKENLEEYSIRLNKLNKISDNQETKKSKIDELDKLLKDLESFGFEDPEWEVKQIAIRSKAKCYEACKNFKEAKMVYDVALTKTPNCPDLLYGYGRLLDTCLDFAEACKQYQKILTNDPHHIKANIGYARSLAHMHRYDDACQILSQQILRLEQSPIKNYEYFKNYVTLIRTYAGFLNDMGLFSKAVEQYKKVKNYIEKNEAEISKTVKDKRNKLISFKKDVATFLKEIKFSIALSLQQNRNFNQAEQAFKAYMKLNAKKTDLSLGRIYQELGRFDESEKIYLAIRSSKVSSLLARAKLYQMQGRQNEGDEMLRQAYEKQPNNSNLIYETLLYFQASERYQEAIAYYEKIPPRKQNDDIFEVMIQIYKKMGNQAATKTTIDLLLKQSPSHIFGLICLAEYFETHGDTAQSNTILSDESLKYSYNPEIQFAWFAFCHRQGSPDSEQKLQKLQETFKYNDGFRINLVKHFLEKDVPKAAQLCAPLIKDKFYLLEGHLLWIQILIKESKQRDAMEYCKHLLNSEAYAYNIAIKNNLEKLQKESAPSAHVAKPSPQDKKSQEMNNDAPVKPKPKVRPSGNFQFYRPHKGNKLKPRTETENANQNKQDFQ